MIQIKQERDVQRVDMAGIETRLEDAMIRNMEQRLEEVAMQWRKDQSFPEDGASCELGDEEDSAQHGGGGEGHGDQAGWVGEQAGHQPGQGGHRSCNGQ